MLLEAKVGKKKNEYRRRKRGSQKNTARAHRKFFSISQGAFGIKPESAALVNGFTPSALLIGIIIVLSFFSLVQLGHQASITGAAVLNSGSVAAVTPTVNEVQFLGFGSLLAVLILAGVLLHVVKEHHQKRHGNH